MEFNQHVIDRRNQIKDNIYKSYHALPAENQIEKSDESDLEKGGEGSRGGQVIGHTESGKPVYASKPFVSTHNSWTRKEHYDAADIHREHAKKQTDKVEKERHLEAAAIHEKMGNHNNSEENRED